jgi:NAD(P)-dependent dehydrogenase (short-subunit alcohol dehydrogenase family)
MTSPNKIALVTGGGSGIGRAVAIGLAKNNYQVIICGRSQKNLSNTQTEADIFAKNIHTIPTNVCQPDDVKILFSNIYERFGRLDLLFNNAGVNTPGLLEDISFDQWRAVVDTNLTGAFLCTQEAFKLMKNQNPQGGRIINNGSISADRPRPNSAPYTATKHAITGLTKATALDGRKYNIACSQIDIGNVDTTMAQTMKTGMPQANGSIEIEPTFEVAHVVDAVIYMAGLPLHANVQFMTVMATNMPLIGRG